MNSNAKDVNRIVLTIKKKRHKPNKNRKNKPETPQTSLFGKKNQNHSSSSQTNDGRCGGDKFFSSGESQEDLSYKKDEVFSSDDEEQEDPKDYCKGGYHPVKIGFLFNNRYRVTRKLGWGHFSTVWLCWDMVEKRFVALKVVKSASHFAETALDEIKLLKCVREGDVNDPFRERVVQLLDDFKICGVNGTHVCMVFEVLGHNLLKLIVKSKYRGIPMPNVKCIIRQVLQGLHYLHSKCQIIHTDIKPENVLLCVDEDYVKRLALNATELHALGQTLPQSFCSTAPKEFQEPRITQTMSKNKKKKLKKKAKKENELLIKQMQQIEELDVSKCTSNNGEEAEECCQDQDINMQEMSDYSKENNLAALPTSEASNHTEAIASTTESNSSQTPLLTTTAAAKTSSSPVNNCALPSSQNFVDQWCSSFSATPPTMAEPNSASEDSTAVALHHNSTAADNEESHNVVPENGGGSMSEMMDGVSTTTSSEETTPVDEDRRGRGNQTMETTGSDGGVNSLVAPKKYPSKEVDPSREVCDMDVKIADLGNACWVNKHFTEDVQTRQYRSLEVLIHAGYDCSADIWSVACMAFELATGDYLFEPHAGDTYSRDEDHLAHIIELLGDIPKKIIQAGKNSQDFFTKRGELRHISGLKPWDLYSVLVEKYDWNQEIAREFADFLRPMLKYDPKKRATAEECLQHPWLLN